MTYPIEHDKISGSGNFIRGIAGEDLGNRKIVYLDTTGTWRLSDADAAASMPAIGLTMHAFTSGKPGWILTQGWIGLLTWTWTAGTEIYASTTAGELTQTPPPAAGDLVQVMGVASTATQINFSPHYAPPGDLSNTLEGYTAYVGFDETKDPKVNYWYCDGTADEVQINLALAYVNGLGGGCVFLEAGTFTLADSITFPGDDLKLHGCGAGTILDGDGLATTEHAIIISGNIHCSVEHLVIQTLGGGTNTIHCIFIEDGSNEFEITHVTIEDSDSNGIHIEGTTISRGHIHDCHIEDTDGHGIYVNMDVGNFMGQLHIADNSIISVGGAGVFFDASGGNNYCTVEGNTIASPDGIGIFLDDSINAQVIANTILLGSLSGIHVLGSDFINVADNIVEACVRNGIFFDQVDNSLIDGNMCNNNDSGNTGTYHGIYTDGSSTDNLITGNQTTTNHGHGIWAEGLRCSVVGNVVVENDLDGLRITSGDCIVNDNHVADNSQDAAGTYHGILLMGSADRCTVSGNHINGFGDSQEDGIHLNNGATEVIIVGNHCQDGMGSGIALAASNDDCTILGNYLFENDDYGIEITAASCDNNRVQNNTFNGNVTAPVLNAGTGTIFHTKQYFVSSDDDVTNETPGKSITNTQKAYIAVHAPQGMQQIMAFNIYVIPNSTQGAANWDLATSYGAIGEANNVHAEAEAAATYNVTNLQWFEIDAFGAGMFASIESEDTGGISVQVATAGHNVTVVMAEMYYV